MANLQPHTTAVQLPTAALQRRHLELSHQLRHAFERLAIHANVDGTTFQPRVKRIGWTSDGDIALVELDEQRLWHIPSSRLTNADVVRKLRRVIGQPIAVLDRDQHGVEIPGIIYVVSYAPRKPDLPDALPVTLADLDAIPADRWLVPVGQFKGESRIAYRSLPQLGHTLIGSATQRGKTSLLNAWIGALAARHTPDRYRVVILDAKATTLSAWRTLPHCDGYATTAPAAVELLARLEQQADDRFARFRAAGCDGWSDYLAAQPDRAVPALHVIVDELPDFILQAGGVESELAIRLGKLAARVLGAGIFLTLAGTEMSHGTVPRLVQANISTRIGFQCGDRYKSITVVQSTGCEKLPAIKGRALWRDTDRPNQLVETQMVYVDRGVTESILARLADQPAPADRPAAAFVPTVEGVPPALAADVARWCLGNTTGVRAVWEAFKARGLSRARAGALLSEWAALGLLGESASVTADRPITEPFRAILAQL